MTKNVGKSSKGKALKGTRQGSSTAHQALKGAKMRDRTCPIKVLRIFFHVSYLSCK